MRFADDDRWTRYAASTSEETRLLPDLCLALDVVGQRQALRVKPEPTGVYSMLYR